MAVDGDIGDLPSPNLSGDEEESVEDTLDHFRQKWRSELTQKTSRHGSNRDQLKSVSGSDGSPLVNDLEAEARHLFEKGIQLERSGKIYDAVAFYRRATQLVPDIEFRMYKFEQQKAAQVNTNDISSAKTDSQRTADTVNDATIDKDELLEKLGHLSFTDDGNFCLCVPDTRPDGAHLSSLPYEVVLYILKWVISSELDMHSLEQVGLEM